MSKNFKNINYRITTKKSFTPYFLLEYQLLWVTMFKYIIIPLVL